MGLWYSIQAIFYPPHQLTEAAIRTKSQLLTIRIRKIKYDMQQRTFQEQSQLLSQFHQPLQVRNREAEKLRMNTIIEKSQNLLVYDEIIQCLDKIIKEAKNLQQNPNTVSNKCLIAISSIIYVYEPLQLNEFINLDEFIPKPYPTISVKEISPILQKYLQKDITFYERNLYALEMAKRNHINLEQINASGHNFLFEPIQPIEETPSAHMFAITLENIHLQEQNLA